MRFLSYVKMCLSCVPAMDYQERGARRITGRAAPYCFFKNNFLKSPGYGVSKFIFSPVTG